MKPHTKEEKRLAIEKLPKPIFDFIGSTTLKNIFNGIQKKSELNLRQMMIFTEIVNVTLMGLESETALETNLHQWLPELSNAAMRELVNDINDRVFKEAKRRLQENITNPEPLWDESALGPKESFVVGLSDAELKKIEEEEKEIGKIILIPDSTEPAEDEGDDRDDDLEAETQEKTSATPAPSILTEKLGIVQTQNTSIPVMGMNVLETTPNATAPTQQPKPLPQETQNKNHYANKVDPYREPIE